MREEKSIKLTLTKAAMAAIDEQWDYYAERQDRELARQWDRSAAKVIESLLVMTERGTPCQLKADRLRNLRWIRITGFPHRIFYLFDRSAGVLRIVHILHDRRDIADLLLEGLDAIES